MRLNTRRLRAIGVSAVVAAATAGVLVTGPAHAAAGFSMTRLAGTDRYQTADKVNQAAFPGGAAGGVVLLADGIPGHQTDALAAAGVEGVNGVGVLVTDNSNSVPANTLAALKDNNVTTVIAVGGPAAVTPAQVSQLQGAGYKVQQPFAGATRYQTMQMIDDSIPAASVGKDSAGNPTAILASGDDHHFVDALSAGGLAFARHFPIILTNSSSSTLQAEAQEVIKTLGIKDLIVVGGTASIPASQYNPPPTGVTTVTDYGGKDRSQTSLDLADFALSNSWLKNTAMAVARGDDGADALAGASFAGVTGIPTLVTNSPTDIGSVPAFGQEHNSTLTGASTAFGGTSAIPDSQISTISVAAGACSTAAAGTIAPKSTDLITADNSCSFVQGGNAYQYKSTDTFQLASASQVPGGSTQCGSDSFADFQTRLSLGDQVISGTYNPSGNSTFCLSDQAPPAPGSVASSGNSTGGGVTVTWTAPSATSADGITAFNVWRAPAMVQNAQQPSQTITCPSVYTVAPGSSPQTPPASPYTSIATVSTASGANYSYNDTSALNPNYYCYGVSSVAPNAIGGTAPASAAPASPPQISDGSTPGATQASLASQGSALTITSISASGQTITVNYSGPINPATVDKATGTTDTTKSNGSDFTVSPTSAANAFTWQEWGSGSQVFIDVSTPLTGPVTVTAQNGADGNSVCAVNSTTACDKPGDAGTASTVAAAGTRPNITNVAGSASNQTVTVTYNEPIDCATVDSSGGQFTINQGHSGSFSPTPQPIGSASCSGTTSTTVVLQTIGLAPGADIQVAYAPDSFGPIVASLSGGAAANTQTITGSVGQ